MDDYTNVLELLKYLISDFSWELLFTTIIGILFTIFGKNKKTRKLFTWIRNTLLYNKKDNKIKESQIINHQVFNFINFWLHNKIPTLSFKTEYRNIVFKQYLTIFCESHYKILKNYAKYGSYRGVDISTLEKQMVRIITDITIDYEEKMISVGIPEVIVSKVRIILRRDLELLVNLIQKITISPVYDEDGNLLKVYSFLNVINTVLESTLINIIEVCDSINGELGGLYMDGKTEPI